MAVAREVPFLAIAGSEIQRRASNRLRNSNTLDALCGEGVMEVDRRNCILRFRGHSNEDVPPQRFSTLNNVLLKQDQDWETMVRRGLQCFATLHAKLTLES